MHMPDPADALADRIEAALARIERAKQTSDAKHAALEREIEAGIAALDRLLETH